MTIPLGGALTAIVYGTTLAFSLVLGGALGAHLRIPQHLVGIALAFASGMLIAAIGFELIFVPFSKIGALPVIGGAAAGALVFSLIDVTLDKTAGRRGWGLVAEQATEGFPESLAVGASAATAGFALFASVALSNIAESMSGAVEMKEEDMKGTSAVAAWSGTGAFLFLATILGYGLSSVMGESATAVLHAVAGGAALSGVSSEIAPEAYERAGLFVTIATVVGFLLGFWLFSLSYKPA